MNKEKLLDIIKNNRGKANFDLTQLDLDGFRSNLKHFQKNDIIYKNGDSASSIFLVLSGEVMVSVNTTINLYSEKEYFGLEIVKNLVKRIGKAIAVKPSVVIELVIYEKDRREIPSTRSSKISKTTDTNAQQALDIKKLSLKVNYDSSFYSAQYKELLIVFVNTPKANLSCSKSFIKHIEDAVFAGQNKLIVDLRACTLIDSTFLGALVKSLRTVVNDAGEMVLVYNIKHQSTLFMITYMDKVFSVFNDLEEAVNSFYEDI